MRYAIGLTRGLMAATLLLVGCLATARAQEADVIPLPEPARDGGTSIEATLAGRRSVRSFEPGPLRLTEVGQLLWAAQGLTEPRPEPEGWPYDHWGGGLRTAPSAGALYPLEIYLLATDVDGLDPGLYRYHAEGHGLERVGDAGRRALADAALGQGSITGAPAALVIAAAYARTDVRYGDRAARYVHIEVGAAAENVYLQAEALELGTVFIGAFRDAAVAAALGLPDDHAPLGIMPVGRTGVRGPGSV